MKYVYFSLISSAVSNSTTVTAPSPTPVTVTAIPYKDTLMVSLTLGLSCVLLIICIGCAIHIHYKGTKKCEMSLKFDVYGFILNCFRLYDSIQSVFKIKFK